MIMRVIMIAIFSTVIAAFAESVPSGPLTIEDLTIRGINFASSREDVKKAFGNPDNISHYKNTDGYNIKYEVWHYKHISVKFIVGGGMEYITLIDSAISTARSIKVGDPISKVRRFYESPTFESEKAISYEAPEVYGELLGITFALKEGKVRSILIGHYAEY